MYWTKLEFNQELRGKRVMAPCHKAFPKGFWSPFVVSRSCWIELFHWSLFSNCVDLPSLQKGLWFLSSLKYCHDQSIFFSFLALFLSLSLGLLNAKCSTGNSRRNNWLKTGSLGKNIYHWSCLVSLKGESAAVETSETRREQNCNWRMISKDSVVCQDSASFIKHDTATIASMYKCHRSLWEKLST